MDRGEVMPKIRTVLVERHDLLRQQIRRLLELQGTVEVVAEVPDASEALLVVHDREVDLVVMDLSSGKGGMKATQLFKAVDPGVRMIVLSSMDSPEYQVAAKRYGLDACISKDRLGESLLGEIDRIFEDKRIQDAPNDIHAGSGEEGSREEKERAQI